MIEIKLGGKEIEEGAKHLIELKNLIIQNNLLNPKGALPEPTLLIVLTGGPVAYRRKDGVFVIPIGCLRN